MESNPKHQNPEPGGSGVKVNAIVYARVSFQGQVSTTGTIKHQNLICNEFASKQGINVVRSFGGYIRTTSDEKREFEKLYAYVKSSPIPVSTILITHMCRVKQFRRYDPDFFDTLKKNGLEIIVVSRFGMDKTFGAMLKDVETFYNNIKKRKYGN